MMSAPSQPPESSMSRSSWLRQWESQLAETPATRYTSVVVAEPTNWGAIMWSLSEGHEAVADRTVLASPTTPVADAHEKAKTHAPKRILTFGGLPVPLRGSTSATPVGIPVFVT